ncbi:MAG: GNAT family N-acetyltransferase [Caldimonas sp.]
MALSEAAAAVLSAQPGAPTPLLDTLTLADVEAGIQLSGAAGWNQTADDWAIFIGRGQAIGYRAGAEGPLIATAAALPCGGGAGWISMVLVDPAWRGRGLASALLAACVERLRATRLVPCLDATPAGAAVYRRLGFVAGFEIDRWESRPATANGRADERPARPGGGALRTAGTSERNALRGAGPADRDAFPAAGPADLDTLRPAGMADLDALCVLDRAATGLERRFLLKSFLARPDTRAWLSAGDSGFVIARDGRRATQIGPLAAATVGEAIGLLGAALAGAPGQPGRAVFLDLPRGRPEVADWLEAQGLVRQRSFVRMSLGAAEPPRLGASGVVLAGPEFG